MKSRVQDHYRITELQPLPDSPGLRLPTSSGPLRWTYLEVPKGIIEGKKKKKKYIRGSRSKGEMTILDDETEKGSDFQKFQKMTTENISLSVSSRFPVIFSLIDIVN